MPSVARRELQETNPHGYVWRILELRGYQQTKLAIERADKAQRPDDAPTGQLAELVNVNDYRMAQRAHERRQQELSE